MTGNLLFNFMQRSLVIGMLMVLLVVPDADFCGGSVVYNMYSLSGIFYSFKVLL